MASKILGISIGTIVLVLFVAPIKYLRNLIEGLPVIGGVAKMVYGIISIPTSFLASKLTFLKALY